MFTWITLFLGAFGFIVFNGPLGGGIINSFDWMENILFIPAFFLTIIALVTLLIGLGIAGATLADKTDDYMVKFLGIGAGGFIGIILPFIMVLKTYLLIWICWEFMDTIDPNMTELSQLTDRNYLLMMIYFGLLILPTLSGKTKIVKKFKEKSKRIKADTVIIEGEVSQIKK